MYQGKGDLHIRRTSSKATYRPCKLPLPPICLIALDLSTNIDSLLSLLLQLKERIKELEDKVKQMERLHPGLVGSSGSSSRTMSSIGHQPSPTSSHGKLEWAESATSPPPSTTVFRGTSPAFTSDHRLPQAVSSIRAGSEPSQYRSGQRMPTIPQGRGPSGDNTFLQVAPDTFNQELPRGLNQREL